MYYVYCEAQSKRTTDGADSYRDQIVIYQIKHKTHMFFGSLLHTESLLNSDR